MYDIKQIKLDLKNILSDYRYQHSLMVANEAKKLANYYKIDSNKAYVAGLLHDIAKEFSEEENEKYIKKYNIDSKYTSIDLRAAIHSYIGAYYAYEKYNIDLDIMHSIMYHTLGSPNMNNFDKIILISDKLGRNNKDYELEKLAYDNLDKAIIYIFEKQKNKLKEKGKDLHEDSLMLLNKLDDKKVN